ncbi:hypothetical protein LINPERHAP2_LOCUS23, partial [Linum perenne]
FLRGSRKGRWSFGSRNASYKVVGATETAVGGLAGVEQLVGEEDGRNCPLLEGLWCWFRVLVVTPSLELRLANRQDRWNQNDEKNVLGHNSGAASRLRPAAAVEIFAASSRFRS